MLLSWVTVDLKGTHKSTNIQEDNESLVIHYISQPHPNASRNRVICLIKVPLSESLHGFHQDIQS